VQVSSCILLATPMPVCDGTSFGPERELEQTQSGSRVRASIRCIFCSKLWDLTADVCDIKSLAQLSKEVTIILPSPDMREQHRAFGRILAYT
jgi:hypothetical protein